MIKLIIQQGVIVIAPFFDAICYLAPSTMHKLIVEASALLNVLKYEVDPEIWTGS